MIDLGKPLFTVFVVWHPSFKDGEQIATAIRAHFRQEAFRNASVGLGIDVICRFVPPYGYRVPRAVNLNESQFSAVVILIDSNLACNSDWKQYIQSITERTKNSEFNQVTLPVLIDSGSVNKIALTEQALCWYLWKGGIERRQKKLIQDLKLEFCRMLRHHFEYVDHPNEANVDEERRRYIKKFGVFLSYSNHDTHGEKIAAEIRKGIQEKFPALTVFMANRGIPAGMQFSDVLLDKVRSSAVVVMHTDSYSSREWCRREVIEAKLHSSPMVVANCIHKYEDCVFPYLGNVPNIRIDDRNVNKRINILVRLLLDELFKCLLCRCQEKVIDIANNSDVMLIFRSPELICLAQSQSSPDNLPTLVLYPDPPIGFEEKELFRRISPQTELFTFMEWKFK